MLICWTKSESPPFRSTVRVNRFAGSEHRARLQAESVDSSSSQSHTHLWLFLIYLACFNIDRFDCFFMIFLLWLKKVGNKWTQDCRFGGQSSWIRVDRRLIYDSRQIKTIKSNNFIKDGKSLVVCSSLYVSVPSPVCRSDGLFAFHTLWL